MVCPNQRVGFAQHNPYAINMDQRNMNCYSCEGFGHLARNCRNRRTGNKIRKERRLDYRQNNGRNNRQNNLNGEGDLIVFN